VENRSQYHDHYQRKRKEDDLPPRELAVLLFPVDLYFSQDLRPSFLASSAPLREFQTAIVNVGRNPFGNNEDP
jgi:hypothetical protein